MDLEKDRNSGEAFIKGFKMATGEVVSMLPSDDFFLPDAISTVMDVFSKNPDCKWVAGRGKIVDYRGKEIRKIITWYKNFLLKHHSFFLLLTESYLTVQAVFFKKELLEQMGDYENVYATTEYDWWIRFAERHRLYVVDKILACFRIHWDLVKDPRIGPKLPGST